MKLPSVTALVNDTMVTCRRFFIPIAFAILGSVYWMILLRLSYDHNNDYSLFYRIIMSCYLGMLASLVLVIFGERKKISGPGRAGLQFMAIAVAAIYYYLLPKHLSESDILRFVLFLIILHLLISVAPFLIKGEINGFWQYNKFLFLRFLAASLYSAVLFLGLALALTAIEKLFSVNIRSYVYGDLWIFIAGIFSTCFFLAGFPGNFEQLESKKDYPRGLKIFTQYILLPIITVYLLILYAYTAKIIFQGQWPYGWVSYLVLALAIAGILSLLLIHPVRHDDDNQWILIYNRFFYFALCPLIILLFLAIARRIRDYGITEPRYFVIALTCWLSGITAYFLLSKKKNIKIVPVTLCILAILGSFGPWGAFSVSLKSQSRSLLRLLEKNKLIDRQQIHPPRGKITDADVSRIESIVQYLIKNHGYRVLQPYFTRNLDSLMVKGEQASHYYAYYEQTSRIMALMNVSASGRPDRGFDYSLEEEQGIKNIAGYDYRIDNFSIDTYFRPDSLTSAYSIDHQLFRIRLDTVGRKLILQAPPGTALEMDLSPVFASLRAKAYAEFDLIAAGEMTLTGENKDLSVKCIIRHCKGEYPNDSLKIKQFSAEILLRRKP